MFVQILRKIRKTDCNTELFSTFLLNNVYSTHFESILPCRVFVAYPPQRLSPILFPTIPSKKADGINPVFKLPTRPVSTPDTVGEVKSSFSPAASRSIAGCGVSHIGEVAHIVTEGLKMSRTDLLPSKFQIDPEHEIDALCRHTVKNIVFPVQHIVGKSVKRKPRSESIRGFQVNEMYIGEFSEI